MIYRRHLAALCAVCAFGASACDGSSPTSPEPVEQTTASTTLHVQPDAALTPGDPSGMVNVAVWPYEAGGTISIDVCVDDAGRPIAASFDAGVGCAEQNGRWAIARDRAGDPWIARIWSGQETVWFERRAGQAPMLFRTSYGAPDGGATRNVSDCRWLLAEGSDVGVACTAAGDGRHLPWTLTVGGSGPAR